MFEKCFEKRAVICFFVIVLLLLSCVMRIAVIINGDYAEVANRQIGYRITVSNIRGTVFDCNMIPLTNREYKIIAAVTPTGPDTALIPYLPVIRSMSERKTIAQYERAVLKVWLIKFQKVFSSPST